jgi:hypothetical protein
MSASSSHSDGLIWGNHVDAERASRHRPARVTSSISVRVRSEVLHEVKRRAEAGYLSVTSWIRRAVQHELNRTA